MITLYVGADDSNHGDRTKGEVIAATFSLNHKDSIVQDFKNGRDNIKLRNWLSKNDTDYRFSLLTDLRSKEMYSNLPYAVPFLIESYLKDNLDLYITKLKINLDGRLTSKDRYKLKLSFPFLGINNVIVDNFIKKRVAGGKIPKSRKAKRIVKRPRCPNVTYMADVLSHSIFSDNSTLENILTDPKMVIIPAYP